MTFTERLCIVVPMTAFLIAFSTSFVGPVFESVWKRFYVSLLVAAIVGTIVVGFAWVVAAL